MFRNHLFPRIVASFFAVLAMTAQAVDWADLAFERALRTDFDHDEIFAPTRLFEKRGKRKPIEADDDRHGPGRGPHIPEPMVFDLVRPLNATKGEVEANILAIFPMKRGAAGTAGLPDAIGTVPLPGKGQGIEWAPEIEWCPRDGVTWEAEFPFIDDLWSTMALIGGRQEIGRSGFRATEYLQNVSLFADVTDRLVVGLETNYQQETTGPAALLLMPQFQWQMRRHLNVQGGAGYRFATDGNLPEAAIRVILMN